MICAKFHTKIDCKVELLLSKDLDGQIFHPVTAEIQHSTPHPHRRNLQGDKPNTGTSCPMSECELNIILKGTQIWGKT